MAWCTTLPVPGFEVIKLSASGASTISCSAGKQALGCHIDPTSSSSELWRQYFPLAAGSGCSCFDTYSAECTVTCANNIKDYELVLTSGMGDVVASCSDPTNRVLGCGIDPSKLFPNAEVWRTVRVISGSSCECHDSFGTGCYAVCGKIWWRYFKYFNWRMFLSALIQSNKVLSLIQSYKMY